MTSSSSGSLAFEQGLGRGVGFKILTGTSGGKPLLTVARKIHFSG